MKKSKPDPVETPEAAPRPRVTYRTGTGGSVTINPPKSDTAEPEPADTQENTDAR
jgi:hypothetical protein